MNRLNGFVIAEGQHKNVKLYEGVIEKSILNNEVELFRFRFKSKDRFNVDFEAKDKCCVLSFINMNDKKSLSFKSEDILNVVSPFSSAVVNCPKEINVSCIFEPSLNYNFIIIKSKSSNLQCGRTNILEKLSEQGNNIQSSFVKTGLPNLAVCETVKKLVALDKTQLESHLIAFGYCNIILGLLFKEKEIKENVYLQSNFFRSSEIKQLELLTSEIKENPEQQYTLSDLCKKTGLSISKLQAGFKRMHNCTVAIFIRDTRLAKAIEMLQQTDLNVSEIVYSVGLNSRSYFCRIFKEKFNCSPKSYQQKVRNSISSVS